MRWRFAMGADRRHVVDIPPAACQQPEILLAPDPLSDRLHRHRRPPRLCPSSRRKPGPTLMQVSDGGSPFGGSCLLSSNVRAEKWVPAFAGTTVLFIVCAGFAFWRPHAR